MGDLIFVKDGWIFSRLLIINLLRIPFGPIVRMGRMGGCVRSDELTCIKYVIECTSSFQLGCIYRETFYFPASVMLT